MAPGRKRSGMARVAALATLAASLVVCLGGGGFLAPAARPLNPRASKARLCRGQGCGVGRAPGAACAAAEGGDGGAAEQAAVFMCTKATDVNKLAQAIALNVKKDVPLRVQCRGAENVYTAIRALVLANMFGDTLQATKQLAVLPMFEDISSTNTSMLVLAVQLVDASLGKADIGNDDIVIRMYADVDDVAKRCKVAAKIKGTALDGKACRMPAMGAPHVNRVIKTLELANQFLRREAQPMADRLVGIPKLVSVVNKKTGPDGGLQVMLTVVPHGKIDTVPA
mmetsp:Transcript_51426/g.159475  ORF Transcript_51426/g.159475 Transcript_51426/m.159475 type:complete len:282 (-) Transcript_51426:174-1019(-)